MLKNQKGFAHHLLLFFVVLAVIAFVGFNVYKAGQSRNNSLSSTSTSQKSSNFSSDNPGGMWASPAVYDQLPDCNGKQLLSNMPVHAGDSYDVIPLGSVNGTGGHTYPTDHMYVNYTGAYGTYTLVSPGNVYLTKVRRITRTVNGVNASDVSAYIMPCKEVGFYFNHIQLSDSLNQAVPATKDPKTNDCAASNGQNSHQNRSNNTTDSDCSQLATKLVKLTPGEIIGTAKHDSNQAGFDFGALDSRAPQLKLLNPASEGDTSTFHGLTYLKTVCPIDYMPAAVQQTVFAMDTFVNRPAADKCGDIAQDKSGTIQGDWYEGAHVTYTADWMKELSVIHNAIDPSLAEISVGGTLGSGGLMAYTPASNSTTNPEPSSTKAGPLYCFSATVSPGNTQSDPSYTDGHKILLQLTSDKTIKAEYQAGSCVGQNSFSQPFTYYR